jgi:dTDP-4-amino-4,6-dideoxygalactose transaminase
MRNVIPVMKCEMPTTEEYLPYLKEIDANQIYTNYGPLELQFREALSKLLNNLNKNRIVTSVNATTAIIQVLQSWQYDKHFFKKQIVICPTWTFVASVSAIYNAGLVPYLVDCDYNEEALMVDILETAINDISQLNDSELVGVVLTLPFGCPINLVPMINLLNKYRIKLIIDAAAAFDSIVTEINTHSQLFKDLTVIVSFHATKAFGIGEGAIIICRDESESEEVRAYGNFGFNKNRYSSSPGFNSKMSEYSCAIGLSVIKKYRAERARWKLVRDIFRNEALNRSYIKKTPQLSLDFISSYGNVRINRINIRRKNLEYDLSQHGIETRKWWNNGIHSHPYFSKMIIQNRILIDNSNFVNTNKISEEILGLPFFISLTKNQIEYIFETIDQLVIE